MWEASKRSKCLFPRGRIRLVGTEFSTLDYNCISCTATIILFSYFTYFSYFIIVFDMQLHLTLLCNIILVIQNVFSVTYSILELSYNWCKQVEAIQSLPMHKNYEIGKSLFFQKKKYYHLSTTVVLTTDKRTIRIQIYMHIHW